MTDAVAAVLGTDVPQPVSNVLSFDDFPIGAEVREGIRGLGFTAPTDVQAASIVAAVAGHDVIVQAKTGSGKTSAFGIPMIERLSLDAETRKLAQGLVLAPTRELAHQVATELRMLGEAKGARVVAIYGGVPYGRQLSAIKAGVDIVVATPGRLLDLVRRKSLALDGVRMMVLDEADEMLSMGFWDDVTDIVKLCPATRQTMLFSATLPYEVAKAAAQYLKEPVRIDVSGDSLTVEGIENFFYHVLGDYPKPRQLLYLLETERPESAIIFCNTRGETEMLAKYLTQTGLVAEPLSGDLRQRDRERVMARIKRGEVHFMVATDIASRGIDISDLSHVINYSLPEFTEVYLHRVGRTGRIGKTGVALSLVDGRGLTTLTQLERQFGIHFTEKKLPREEDVVARRSERIMRELSERAAVSEVGQHMPVADEILKNEDARQVVAFLLKSFYTDEAERRANDNGPRPEPVQARNDGRSDSRNDGPAPADSENGLRRKRRRRRPRRRAGGEGPMEMVDAADMLSREPVSDMPLPPEGVALAIVPAPDAVAAPAMVTAEEGVPVERAAAHNGMARLKVNIGFNDGFKGRGSVAKKISALAGLNDGIITEVEARRDHAVLMATQEIAELVVERVDGAQIGKKIVSVALAN
mgnify:CR=1 FL=1